MPITFDLNKNYMIRKIEIVYIGASQKYNIEGIVPIYKEVRLVIFLFN